MRGFLPRRPEEEAFGARKGSGGAEFSKSRGVRCPFAAKITRLRRLEPL